MKQLRVLTGRHAGADLPLASSSYLISADPESDLAITDWTSEPLVLTVPHDDEAMSQATIRIGNEGVPQVLDELCPRRFGDIVLCLGPTDRPWPSDMELLQSLLQPTSALTVPADAAEPAPATSAEADDLGVPGRPGRYRLALAAATLGLASLTAAFALVVSDANRAAEPKPLSMAAQAQRALDTLGVSTVSVRTAGNNVVVEGLLDNPSDVSRVRSALAVLPAGVVQSRFAAASDIALNIADALGAPGLKVRYLSRGEFLVEGEAVHAPLLRAASDRIVNDLSPLVRAIRLSVVDLPPPPRTPTGAMLSTAGMKYVQTRDGIKHISLFTLPALDLTADRAGLPLPATAQ